MSAWDLWTRFHSRLSHRLAGRPLAGFALDISAAAGRGGCRVERQVGSIVTAGLIGMKHAPEPFEGTPVAALGWPARGRPRRGTSRKARL